jgi:glycosyltransferase involved in cell wall biosynthesis
MKKIVLIGPCYPYRGGNALTMSYLYKALMESGQYEVVFVNFSLLYPEFLFPGTTQYDESEEHFERVPTHRLVNSINPISWWRTAQFVRSQQPDLVAIDWWQPFFGVSMWAISRLLLPLYKNKILFITENVISHEARFVDRILTRIGLANADKFLCFSQQVVNDLKPFRLREQPIFRSELPIYDWFKPAEESEIAPTRTRLGFAPSDKVILFFGYVRKYKGLDILIEAFAQLAPKMPELKLLICGEFYDDPKEYTDLIARLGIAQSTVLVNQYIPNEEVMQYFAVSELVVQPYRSATQSGILNMAYGALKPVVVTNVGGLQEFVDDGKTGIIVPTSEAHEVANGILRYFSLKDQTDFAKNIQLRVSENAFSKIVGVFDEMKF